MPEAFSLQLSPFCAALPLQLLSPSTSGHGGCPKFLTGSLQLNWVSPSQEDGWLCLGFPILHYGLETLSSGKLGQTQGSSYVFSFFWGSLAEPTAYCTMSEKLFFFFFISCPFLGYSERVNPVLTISSWLKWKSRSKVSQPQTVSWIPWSQWLSLSLSQKYAGKQFPLVRL